MRGKRRFAAVRPLAVIGNLSRDVVDGGPPRVGGAPYYAARALRALGRPAIVVTKCTAAELLAPLVALGVPVVYRPGQPTGFEITNHGNDRTMTIETVGVEWTPEDVRGWAGDALRRAEWVHVAPLLRGDFPVETLSELARGRRLSLDGQGLVRPRKTGRLELDGEADLDLLGHLSILKLAEEEARALVGSVDERALRALGVPEIVVTLGERGSLVLAEGAVEEIPARPAAGRIDPTGAGDAFAVAYLAARSSGYRPAAAARRATTIVDGLLAGRLS